MNYMKVLLTSEISILLLDKCSFQAQLFIRERTALLASWHVNEIVFS